MKKSLILEASILIVDDTEANIILLTRMLINAGYSSVSSTMKPAEVCGLYMENFYDIIILDLQMPIVDGFHVMSQLRDVISDEYLPVVVITAQPTHKLKALQAGARDFITKPFDQTEVLIRVRNLIEVRLLEKKLRGYNEFLEQVCKAGTSPVDMANQISVEFE